jgi:CubicO group peptidase (beta-lactamase class C family)
MQGSITLDLSRIENAAKVAEEAVKAEDYQSAVLAVANREGILWRHVVSGDDGVVWESIFPIASITKPMVVTALMQLVERGRAVLSDPVAEYIPEFAQNGKEGVTLWHLVTHTSGLEEPTGEHIHELFDRREPTSTFLDLACKASLSFEPGTRWSYGVLTFTVLGELITRISGQPYPEFMREHTFAPLAMVGTSFVPQLKHLTPVNMFRSHEDFTYFNTLATPAGGLYSTADDLVAFGRAFLNNGKLDEARVLSEAAVRTMTRVHTEGIMAIENGKPRPTYTGLGWGMRSPQGNVLGSERAYGHAGASGSWVWIDPEWDLVFALMSNSEGSKPSTPIRMLNAVYGALER